MNSAGQLSWLLGIHSSGQNRRQITKRLSHGHDCLTPGSEHSHRHPAPARLWDTGREVEEVLSPETRYTHTTALDSMMHTVWWRKRVILWSTVAFLLWLMLRKASYNVKFETVINNSKAGDVWDYVADFSNAKNLNPTILDFTIEDESGNYAHWFYTVHYTEYLSHLPALHNYAVAHFELRPLSETSFVIHSTHQTCFYTSLACVNSKSSFSFKQKNDSTLCIEEVNYECPQIFSKVCKEEVLFQRRNIMQNLQTIFSQKTKQA